MKIQIGTYAPYDILKKKVFGFIAYLFKTHFTCVSEFGQNISSDSIFIVIYILIASLGAGQQARHD
jgi:hypothetical protein